MVLLRVAAVAVAMAVVSAVLAVLAVLVALVALVALVVSEPYIRRYNEELTSIKGGNGGLGPNGGSPGGWPVVSVTNISKFDIHWLMCYETGWR